jgi:hypothetical protein
MTAEIMCGYCQSPIDGTEAEPARCPACSAVYHAECWSENGGCAVYGCTAAPEIEVRQPIEIPVSYWGQENKPCPACGREILAAAVRCRRCGTTFDSAQPVNAADFHARARADARLPALRRALVVCFVLSIVPCAAPFGAIASAIQLRARRADVAKLPSIYGALARLGVGVGFAQTAALIVVLFVYQAARR